MNSQQIMAILSTCGEPHTVTYNYDDATAYERAVESLQQLGEEVEFETIKHGGGGQTFESARALHDRLGFARVTLLSPLDYQRPGTYHPDELIRPTNEGRLALQVLQGGVAS